MMGSKIALKRTSKSFIILRTGGISNVKNR